MGDENVIPLNDELLTVAKIADISAISNHYILTEIAAVLDSGNVSNMFDNDISRLKNIKEVVSFFADTPLVTVEFKDAASRVLDVLNQYISGLVLTESNITTLKSSLSFIYVELVEYGKVNIGLLKPIVFSLVDSELESALYKISTYQYAGIARMNSLIYKNVNSLVTIHNKLNRIAFMVNNDLAKIDVMVDMSKVTKSHSRFSLVNDATELYFKVYGLINKLTDDKFITSNSTESNDSIEVDVNTTDLVLLNTINEFREKIKAVYSTIRIDRLSDIFNFNLDNVFENTERSLFQNAEFKESLFKLKCNIDIIAELVCYTTDCINDSVEKLKKSIPVSANEIDNIDTI